MEEGISRKNLTGECLKAKGLQFLYGKMSKFFVCKERVHRNSIRFTKWSVV